MEEFSSGRRRIARALLAIGVAALSATAATSSALALPPGGASPDTPGTSAVVWPTLLAPGEDINFAITGFPAGETVNIKIDDGEGYSDTSVAGSGVVHMQAIRADGTVQGSFALDSTISEGEHWLRFLASEPILDDSGSQIGVNGYTLGSGSEFVIADADTVEAAREAGTAGPMSYEEALALAESGDAAVAETSESSVDEDEERTDAGESEQETPTETSGEAFSWLPIAGIGVAIALVLAIGIGLFAGRRARRGSTEKTPPTTDET